MGNNFQKLLWASTSVKANDLNPEYYCYNLPQTDTVNTLPLETIDYLLKSKTLASENLKIQDKYNELVNQTKKYFDLEKITDSLLDNGIELFQESYHSVLETIDLKASKLIKK